MADTSMTRLRWIGAGVGALGAGVLVIAAPVAAAEPAEPAEPAVPVVPVVPVPAPLEVVEPAPVPPEAAPVSLEAPAAAPAVPVEEGVSHLPSPDSLPPGTTQTPPDSGRLGYLRDLWHAVRTQDVTMTDAFLLFAQRPVDTKSIAPGSMSPAPQIHGAPPAAPAAPEQLVGPAAAPVLEAESAQPAAAEPATPEAESELPLLPAAPEAAAG